jgi:hypothetical protein
VPPSRAALRPLLYTLKFHLQFPHFELVFHFFQMQLLVDLNFLTPEAGHIRNGHNQYNHGKNPKRNYEW